jgi:methyl-accepting chemotaxis protein
VYNHILNSIQSKLLIPVVIFTIISIIAGFYYVYTLKTTNTELVGISTANAVSKQVQNLRSFYSQTIVSRAKKAGVKVHYNYLEDDETIPVPATLVNILGESFEKEYPGSTMRLYSRFPFRNKSKIETYDSFELEALDALEKDPSKPFYKLEKFNGQLSLRYAVPDIMKASCVGCHNTHPQSPKQDWKVGDVRGALEVIIPVGEANAISGTIAMKLFGFIGLPLFGMTLIMAFVYRKTVIRPIKSISETNERIRSGDLKARAIVYSHDEMGMMASGFNLLLDRLLYLVETKETERAEMQDSIMKLLEEVSDAATGDLTVEANVTEDMTGAIADSFNHMIYQLRQIVLNVQQATMLVSSSANQIQQNAEQLAEGSTTQAEQILDSAAALDEMTVSIQQVSENASLSAAVADQALYNAKQGSTAVQNTIQAMDRMRNKVQETATRIRALGERSQEIGEIVNLIAEIADRTSVLALNASIEASLAGDAGQGFAIVAQEVERLAVRASEATKQIHDLVDGIRGETHEAMIVMEESTSEVDRGYNVADQAGQALREIENVSSRLADLIQSISLAATQQARGSENLSKAMSEISDITQQTSYGTTQAALSINQLARLAIELRESVRTFKLPM